jgi:hypothetical protein
MAMKSTTTILKFSILLGLMVLLFSLAPCIAIEIIWIVFHMVFLIVGVILSSCYRSFIFGYEII